MRDPDSALSAFELLGYPQCQQEPAGRNRTMAQILRYDRYISHNLETLLMEAATIHLGLAQCTTSGMGGRTICPKCEQRMRWYESVGIRRRPLSRGTTRFAGTWRITVVQASIEGQAGRTHNDMWP